MPRRPVGKRSVSDGEVRVRGKASNGEGSVYFAKDGRWRATYRVPGEGRQRSVSARTRELAVASWERRLAELALAPESSLSPPVSISVGDPARWWLHNVQKHQVRASTWSQAEDRVDKIVATIGSMQVHKLRVEHVIAWQGQLLDTLAIRRSGTIVRPLPKSSTKPSSSA